MPGRITSFAAGLNGEYVRKFGDPPIPEYGKGLWEYTRSVESCQELRCPPSELVVVEAAMDGQDGASPRPAEPVHHRSPGAAAVIQT